MMLVPMSRFEFEQIDLGITSPLANQPVALKSERASDQRQSAAVTRRSTWVFHSYLSSTDLIDFIPIDNYQSG